MQCCFKREHIFTEKHCCTKIFLLHCVFTKNSVWIFIFILSTFEICKTLYLEKGRWNRSTTLRVDLWRWHLLITSIKIRSSFFIECNLDSWPYQHVESVCCDGSNIGEKNFKLTQNSEKLKKLNWNQIWFGLHLRKLVFKTFLLEHH